MVLALTSLEFSEDFTVRAAVSGALWQLEGKEQHVKDVEKATANTFDEYVSKGWYSNILRWCGCPWY